MTAHARLAPSAAHIWAADDGCRGSVALQAAYPDAEDSPAAREGTAAHWYVTETLLGREIGFGSVAPNGVPIDAEMVDCAQGILIDVRDTLLAHPGATLLVEQRLPMMTVHAECFGTPDVVLIDWAKKTLFVWDYKYGHRFVDAVGNLQLLLYAIGAFEFKNIEIADWHIVLTIAQPRNYHGLGPIREWSLSARQMADKYVPQLRASALEAMQPDAPFRTGEHCRDCSGRHVCPALQQSAALSVDVSLQAQPLELTPPAVGLELRQISDAIKRLEARQTGLEEQALSLIRGGTRIPFYSLEPTTGHERWTLSPREVVALGGHFGINLSKEATLTPKQARKAGMPPGAMQGMSETPRGALRLIRVRDDAAKLAFE